MVLKINFFKQHYAHTIFGFKTTIIIKDEKYFIVRSNIKKTIILLSKNEKKKNNFNLHMIIIIERI